MGAAPIGIPGWPELAFWTASMARKRIVFIDLRATESEVVWVDIGRSGLAEFRRNQTTRKKEMSFRFKVVCEIAGQTTNPKPGMAPPTQAVFALFP